MHIFYIWDRCGTQRNCMGFFLSKLWMVAFERYIACASLIIMRGSIMTRILQKNTVFGVRGPHLWVSLSLCSFSLVSDLHIQYVVRKLPSIAFDRYLIQLFMGATAITNAKYMVKQPGLGVTQKSQKYDCFTIYFAFEIAVEARQIWVRYISKAMDGSFRAIYCVWGSDISQKLHSDKNPRTPDPKNNVLWSILVIIEPLIFIRPAHAIYCSKATIHSFKKISNTTCSGRHSDLKTKIYVYFRVLWVTPTPWKYTI